MTKSNSWLSLEKINQSRYIIRELIVNIHVFITLWTKATHIWQFQSLGPNRLDGLSKSRPRIAPAPWSWQRPPSASLAPPFDPSLGRAVPHRFQTSNDKVDISTIEVENTQHTTLLETINAKCRRRKNCNSRFELMWQYSNEVLFDYKGWRKKSILHSTSLWSGLVVLHILHLVLLAMA